MSTGKAKTSVKTAMDNIDVLMKSEREKGAAIERARIIQLLRLQSAQLMNQRVSVEAMRGFAIFSQAQMLETLAVGLASAPLEADKAQG